MKSLTNALNQNLKTDPMMQIHHSARLFRIVFSDIRLVFLEHHTYVFLTATSLYCKRDATYKEI